MAKITSWFRHLIPGGEAVVAAFGAQFGMDRLGGWLKGHVDKHAERIVNYYAVYSVYRLTGRVPEVVNDIWQQARASILEQHPNEWRRLQMRLRSRKKKERDHFRIMAVQVPAKEADPKLFAKAVENTVTVLRDWARMTDDEFKDEFTNLDLFIAESERAWTKVAMRFKELTGKSLDELRDFAERWELAELKDDILDDIQEGVESWRRSAERRTAALERIPTFPWGSRS